MDFIMSLVGVTSVLLVCLALATGETLGPTLKPREQTLRVVKTTNVGTVLTSLETRDRFVRFAVLDASTERLARIEATNGKPYQVQIVLKTSLHSEKTPSTRRLYITATSNGIYTSTATIALHIVDPVSSVVQTPLTDLPEAKMVVSSHVQSVKSLCNNGLGSSSLTGVSRFRMFCLLFFGVYGSGP